jgi:dipeptidyl aminopeptidase/acylaminoacyl peptidase
MAIASAIAGAHEAEGAPAAYRLEHALTLQTFADVTWSPDGRRIALAITAVDTAENATNQDLWLLDPAAGTRHRLTRHAKADFSPSFSPSGDTIAFVGNRVTGDDPRSTIYMMSLHGGEPWPFGEYDESVSEVAWSPDGRWLAYVKLDTLPKPVREWRKKKWDHVVEDERLQIPQLWVVEIANGKQRRLTSGTDHLWYARWSPDSRSIAILTRPTGKPDDQNLTDIAIVALDRGIARKLDVIGDAFTWSPDGRWIAWAAGTDRAKHVEKTDLWVAAAAGGRAVKLTAGFDEDAGTPVWNATSDTLFFHAAQGAGTRVVMVARAGGSMRLGVERAADAGTAVGSPRGGVAWVQSDPEHPAELWVAAHPDLEGAPVTDFNAAIARLELGSTRALRWTSSDGIRVEGLLLRPRGAPERAALKTIVLLHDGPYGSRYALGFQAIPQWFATHGYQIFMPNFRSSGGYGTAFMLRRRSDWGGQDWRDVSGGIDTLVRLGLADGKRLAVYGGSYGGYLSAWAITQTDRFDAACVIAGAVNLAAHFGQSDIQRYRAFDFEGYPWETPEAWRRSSPITHIARARTPTLILIGEEDRRVPYPQAQELYRALVALKVPTEFVHYPREGHGVREYRHRWDFYTRMLRWFERWVR